MAKINLPSEMLQKEAFKSFPAKEKEEYARNLLGKILQLNREGVTISQIKESTGMTYSTIWHHLEILSSTAQALKVSRGNLDVFYPTGEINHLNDYDVGNIRYSVSTVENNEGKFVCIHEKKENRSGNQKVCKGINVPFEIIDNLIEILKDVKK